MSNDDAVSDRQRVGLSVIGLPMVGGLIWESPDPGFAFLIGDDAEFGLGAFYGAPGVAMGFGGVLYVLLSLWSGGEEVAQPGFGAAFGGSFFCVEQFAG